MKKTINIQAFIIGCFITLFISSAFGAESTKDTPITTNLNQPNIEAFSTPDPSITSSRGCLPSIKKYTKSNFFVYGETGGYGIKIENKGRGICYGVKFVDTLPQGMSLSQESVFKGWDCKVSKAIFPAVVTLTCHYKLPLLPNATAHMGFNVNIPSLEDAGGVGWGKMSVANCAKAYGAGITAHEPPTQPITTSCIKTEVQENKRPFKLKVGMPYFNISGGEPVYSFKIPTNPSEYAYNYNVDCDSDGVYEATGVNGDYTCEYSTNDATYIVSISGEFPHLYHPYLHFDYDGLSLLDRGILSVEQWGDIEWRSMRKAFNGALKMTVNALDVPDLTRVTDISRMFAYAMSFNQSLDAWDVSNITNMEGMFLGASAFNQPLEGWDVSNVTDMRVMFREASDFNQPLEGWDVSNVTDMIWMFLGASAFNQPLEGWDVSKVTGMGGMFSGASAFNQPLEGWDVSNVTGMGDMFLGVSAFNQPLEGWDVSNVTGMGDMFLGASAFNQPLEGWNVSNVTMMHDMFREASVFNQPLKGWDVSNVTTMHEMFREASDFNQPLEGWDVSNVMNMGAMFRAASDFNQPLGGWDVSNVKNMGGMFSETSDFNQPLEGWDVSNVRNMGGMFREASDFNQPLEGWDVSNVRNMWGMFYYAESFANNDLSVWDVSNVSSHYDFLTGAGSGNIEPIWN